MNYNEMTERAHSNAVKHGFWDKKQSNEHCLMLVITEIAEMVEADRKNDKAGVGAKLLMRQDMEKGEMFDDVFVRGRLSLKTYQDKHGNTQIAVNVNANEVTLCGLKGESQPTGATTQAAQAQPQASDNAEDDLPF